MSLFETKAELSESIEEYEEMRSTTREQLRTAHVPATHHLDQQERQDFQRPYPAASFPPPSNIQGFTNTQNQSFNPNTCALQTSQIAKIFADSINISRLPIPQPEVFTGDPLKFNSWMSSFSILI